MNLVIYAYDVVQLLYAENQDEIILTISDTESNEADYNVFHIYVCNCKKQM